MLTPVQVLVGLQFKHRNVGHLKQIFSIRIHSCSSTKSTLFQFHLWFGFNHVHKWPSWSWCGPNISPGGRRLWSPHGWSSCQWRSRHQPEDLYFRQLIPLIELFCLDCPTWISKWDLWNNKKENLPLWHALPRRTMNLWGSPRLLLRGGGSPCTQAAWHSSLHRYLRYNIIAQILVSCWSFVYFLVWDFQSFFLFGFVIVLHI